jgi:hypothetical protein
LHCETRWTFEIEAVLAFGGSSCGHSFAGPNRIVGGPNHQRCFGHWGLGCWRLTEASRSEAGGGQVSRLKLSDRLAARRAAREIWIASKTDAEVAKLVKQAVEGDEDAQRLLFATHPEMPMGIDPATLFLLIEIALKLWIWWQQNKVEKPSELVDSSEPFDDDE